MKFFLFFGLALLGIANSMVAQISNFYTIGGVPLRITKYEKVEGSPYFGNGKWENGSVVDINGIVYKNIPLRYNAYDDELEIKKDNQVLILDRKKVIGFEYTLLDEFGRLKNCTFKSGFSFSIDFDQYAYFRVLYDDRGLKILERVKTIQIKVTPAAYGESDYTKFIADSDTYLITSEGSEKITINQKSLANAFPQHKSKIREYIKSKNLDVKEEEDLRETCNYIRSIMEEGL
jgi:hypothetical protein